MAALSLFRTISPGAGKISPGIMCACDRIIASLANWIVNGNELGAVGKRRFHLHLADHFADAFHDLIAGQYFAACGHELGNGHAVPCPLHDDVCYERDAFGIVELDACGEPSASDKRGE